MSEFAALPLAEKREIVLSCLLAILGRNQTFDRLYEFIKEYPNQVTESDYEDVYGVIEGMINETSKEKESAAIAKLASINDRLALVRAREEEEKRRENTGLDEMLTAM